MGEKITDFILSMVVESLATKMTTENYYQVLKHSTFIHTSGMKMERGPRENQCRVTD